MVIEAPWLIFIAYWFLASLSVNKIERRRAVRRKARSHRRDARGLVSSVRQRSALRRSQPPIRSVAATGSSSSALRSLGRAWRSPSGHAIHIGRYWSASVALKAGHELIRTGPYSRIRHPIYTGMLMAVAGTALAVGRYRGIVAFAIILRGFIWKSKREEALLAGQFGAAFEEHRRHTGFFLPRLS